MIMADQSEQVEEKAQQNIEAQKAGSPDAPSHVVGIGASAGGLEALETFFRKTDNDTGLAFVVVQHLSPDFKSLMDELLSRHTSMPVNRVEDGMFVKKNNIYLIPPKKDMVISGGKLLLRDKDPHQGLSLPIDIFFRSLAKDCGDRAIGIVLSGTGSDGSRGIMDIHEAGGLVMVQDEGSAKFDGMPSSAIRTGISDYIISPERMPAVLLKFTNHPLSQGSQLEDESAEPENGGFSKIFTMLKNAYRIDFNHYKMSTIGRRIERRMSFHRYKRLEDYVNFLESNKEELDSLYKDLLIGVTKFFRDPEAFDFLKSEVIPKIIKSADKNDEIRVWVPGCATGEEIYSIAIIFHECCEGLESHPGIKIFATDIHRELLDFAAAGVFSETTMENVSNERLEKFFLHEGQEYQIKPELRKMVVFAEHNVIKDPPFTKIDLISCRNLLIYFMPNTQKKVISLFHFALKTHGILFLGPSESIGGLESEFENLNHRWKFFSKRRDVRLPVSMRFPGGPDKNVVPHTLQQSNQPAYTGDLRLSRAYDSLLEKFIPPSVLVNENMEVVHMFGDAYRYFRHSSGRTRLDIINMSQGDLKIAITTAINRVKKNNEPVNYKNIRVTVDNVDQYVRLRVEPIREKNINSLFYLVSVEAIKQIEKPAPAEESEDSGFNVDEQSTKRISDLEQELQYTKENLQATVEELETSNEELQASNEELMASNEELQSTNEELHSVNEELYTVNGEYERKIDELTEITNDMDNLLKSTKIGTVFLDKELRIRKFTPAIAHSFNLLPQDVGRPIDHISYNIVGNPGLMNDIRQVLGGGEIVEREVKNHQGKWFVKRILPYYNEGGICEGVVLTFVDISQIKEAEKAVNESSERFRKLVENMPAVLYTAKIDDQYSVTYVNRHIEKILGYDCDQFIKDSNGWLNIIHPDYADKYKEAVEKAKGSKSHISLEYEVRNSHGVYQWVKDESDIIFDENECPLYIQGIISEITKRKIAEFELSESEKMLREASEASLDALFILNSLRNENGKVVDFEFVHVNSQAEQLMEINRQELIGKCLCEVLPVYRSSGMFDKFARVPDDGQPVKGEVEMDCPPFKEKRLFHQAVKVGDGIAITARINCLKCLHSPADN